VKKRAAKLLAMDRSIHETAVAYKKLRLEENAACYLIEAKRRLPVIERLISAGKSSAGRIFTDDELTTLKAMKREYERVQSRSRP
jgi:hypothetical protein